MTMLWWIVGAAVYLLLVGMILGMNWVSVYKEKEMTMKNTYEKGEVKMDKKKNYKLYELGGNVLDNYRKYVKGNETASKALVRRKLTRNIDLAVKLSDNVNGRNTSLYAYGNLHIFVRYNTITKIINKQNYAAEWFYKDEVKYKELSELYEIDKYERLSNGEQSIVQTNTYENKIEEVVVSEVRSGWLASLKMNALKLFKRNALVK